MIKKGLLLVFILLAFWVSTQNPQTTSVNYIIASSQLPVATLMAICLGLGCIIGLAIGVTLISKLKWQNHRLKKSSQLVPSSKS